MNKSFSKTIIGNMYIISFLLIATSNHFMVSASQKQLIKEIIILEIESYKYEILKKNIIYFRKMGDDDNAHELSEKIKEVRYKKNKNEYVINIDTLELFDGDSICDGFKYYSGFHTKTILGANTFQYSTARAEFLIAMNKANYFYVLQSPVASDKADFFKNEIKVVKDRKTATLLARGYAKIQPRDIPFIHVIDELNFSNYSVELEKKPFTKETENGFEVFLYYYVSSNEDEVGDFKCLKLSISKDCSINELQSKESKTE